MLVGIRGSIQAATASMPFIIQNPDQAGRTLHLSDQVRSGMKPSTVFIIDQDAAVRDALSVTLRANGFDVLTFGSAGEFLRILPIRQTGCLLIEFDLVDMTGAELVVRLNGEPMDLPAIIMTTRLRMPDFGHPRPAGIAATLQKPFGQDELLTCLCRVLGRSFGVGATT